MNNSLGNIPANAANEKIPKEMLTIVYSVDGNEIKLTPSIVQDFIVGGGNATITLSEYKFFAELCKARSLNPFLKEAYCIKYGNEPAQIVVGKDAILKRAILNANYDGMESGIIVMIIETGEIIERNGLFYLKDKEKLVGGWARVYRKDWSHPTYCSVSFDEVATRKKDGALNFNWNSKGATMVEKVAKVRALRETFIEQLGGMQDIDEITEYNSDLDNIPVANKVDVQIDEVAEPEPSDISIADL